MKSFLSSITLISILIIVIELINKCKTLDITFLCGGCLALIEEINWETGITSPKKTIQIGNFRIDSNGDLAQTNKIPLKTSEIFLTEVFENVCSQMSFYAKSTADNGDTNFIRVSSRDGQTISKINVEETQTIRDSLKYACETILEENDDWLIPFYQKPDEDINKKLCVDKTGVCSANNVTDQMWAYASAVMAGLSEKYPEFQFSKSNEAQLNDDSDDVDNADNEIVVDDDDDDDDNEIKSI